MVMLTIEYLPFQGAIVEWGMKGGRDWTLSRHRHSSASEKSANSIIVVESRIRPFRLTILSSTKNKDGLLLSSLSRIRVAVDSSMIAQSSIVLSIGCELQRPTRKATVTDIPQTSPLHFLFLISTTVIPFELSAV
jgi:hypothetical protein